MKTTGKRIFIVGIVFVAVVYGFLNQNNESDEKQTFTTVFGNVELQYPEGWFKNPDEHPYDLQCFSRLQKMTTGIFQFNMNDLAEGFTPEGLLNAQVEDLKSKRKNFTMVEQKTTTTTRQTRETSVVYAGENGSGRYYYRFTLIQFSENTDITLVVIQAALPGNWKKHKPVLEEITQSARLIAVANQT